MTLHTGQKLSSCDILGSLGAGAMGEVYRARDSRLDRDVAILSVKFEPQSDDRLQPAVHHEHVASVARIASPHPEQRLGQRAFENSSIAMARIQRV